MQQSVLLSAIRGPDGIAKHHQCKALIRWFRRCILIAAFEGKVITNPFTVGGGSFTGPIDIGTVSLSIPWETQLNPVIDLFLRSRDELPFHYYTHFMHAVEVLGYKHPDTRIRTFWYGVYVRMVNALHLFVESQEQMDFRLGDNMEGWVARSDEDSVCSD